jgi:hypothetical protein
VVNNSIWVEGQCMNRPWLPTLNKAEHLVWASPELSRYQGIPQLWNELISYWAELADLPVANLPLPGVAVGHPQVV